MPSKEYRYSIVGRKAKDAVFLTATFISRNLGCCPIFYWPGLHWPCLHWPGLHWPACKMGQQPKFRERKVAVRKTASLAELVGYPPSAWLFSRIWPPTNRSLRSLIPALPLHTNIFPLYSTIQSKRLQLTSHQSLAALAHSHIVPTYSCCI